VHVYPSSRGNALDKALDFEPIEQEPYRPAIHAEDRSRQLKVAMHDVQQEPVAPERDEHVTVVRIRPLVPILDFSERCPRPFGIRADVSDTQLGLPVDPHLLLLQ
jgi:hypothetical protein